MANFEDRQQQYEQNDVPAAWRTYVANGIRKKFADEFDFGDMSDQEVIQHHHDRFGSGMSDQAYKDKLDKTYGTGFTPPPAPKQTLGDRAAALGETGKALAEGIVPFVVPEVGKGIALKAGAKAVATKIPVASQIGFLGGHAINEAVDVATARALEKTAAALPVPNEDAKAQEFYDKLSPSLLAKGYTQDQIMQEARARAQNVSHGYQDTIASIDKNVEETQRQAVTEPARAAADAFFLGVGAPIIEGALQRGLAKVGLIKTAEAVAAKPAANVIGTVASHIKAGAIIGAPGMGIQGAISAGVQAAADNKTPDEIGKALVAGGVKGVKEGAVGGAILGALGGTLEAGVGAVAGRVRQAAWRESRAQAELDDARLRGWQERNAQQERLSAQTSAQKRDAIMRTADDFNPHTTTADISGDPAEAATTIIQQAHGDEAAMSEAGMRAASKIEERLRLYQDANADVAKFGERELPPAPAAPEAPAAGAITGSEMPPTPQAPPQLGPPLGPIERGGRELPPPTEIAPRALGPTTPEPEAPSVAAAPKVEFSRVGPDDFRKAVKRALNERPEAAGSLAVHPASYYAKPGVEMYMTSDGKTGYALVPRPEGGKELVSAFNTGEKGLGLAGVREAVLRGATHLDALKTLEPLYEKAGFVTTRTEKNYTPGQPDVVYMEQPGAPQAAPPASAPAAAPAAKPVSVGEHAVLSEGEGGAIHIERLGLPPGRAVVPGATGKALDTIVRAADERQVPVTTQITQVAGPRGGHIPVEKMIPWYEARGFKVVSTTKLPEGQIATATLRREPVPPPALKIGMLEAEHIMMERAIESGKTPAARELAAPAITPAPGRWHQMNLWADANIAAASERIKQREAEFPAAERKRAAEAGFVGERKRYWTAIKIGDRVYAGRGTHGDVFNGLSDELKTAAEEKSTLGFYSPDTGKFVLSQVPAIENALPSEYSGPDRGIRENAPEKVRDVTGFVHRDPTSYDWADFADRVQIGVNVILKHGLNKAEWVEHMVRELGGKFRDIADRVYQEAVAAYHARRPKGVDEVRRVVDDYAHKAGLGLGATRHDFFPEVDPKFAGRVATAYHLMDNPKPGTPEYHEAELSYKALNQEVKAQYDAMIAAGYKVTFTKDDPYPTSADMRADVAQNKHIKVFDSASTRVVEHPFVTREQNNMFRAVHDFFGHAAEGYEFGPRGEDAAFRKHASTLSNAAIPALATETRGQNSWVNYWPANAKLEPKDRPFADQKWGLLPSWAYDDVVKARSQRAPSNKLGAGVPRTAKVAGAFEKAAQSLARGVRPVTRPDAVRARFVADGTDTINEMMRVSPQSANWYHDDIKKMHDMVAERLPEAGTPGGQALFDLLLAFTSPMKPVTDNFAIAFRLMQDYTRTGKVPMLQRFGQEINPAARSWVPRLNGLIEKHGGNLDAMRDYLLTKSDKGVYNVQKEFGPKVGPFTLNIQGIHDQVTVDAWMVRRLRRLTGQMFKTVDGKRVYNDEVTLTAREQRDIEAGIHELSRKTGLDPDAIQAILWDNEKMVWERAGHSAPRIPFSVAAESVFSNMEKNAAGISAKHAQQEFPPLPNTPLVPERQKIASRDVETFTPAENKAILKAVKDQIGLTRHLPGDLERNESQVYMLPNGTFTEPHSSRGHAEIVEGIEEVSGVKNLHRRLNENNWVRIVTEKNNVMSVDTEKPLTVAQRIALGKYAKEHPGLQLYWDFGLDPTKNTAERIGGSGTFPEFLRALNSFEETT